MVKLFAELQPVLADGLHVIQSGVFCDEHYILLEKDASLAADFREVWG